MITQTKMTQIIVKTAQNHYNLVFNIISVNNVTLFVLMKLCKLVLSMWCCFFVRCICMWLSGWL